MRQEHDAERDVMRFFLTDDPAVETTEHSDGPVRHVMHTSADGQLVLHEIHGYSKLAEMHEKTKRSEVKANENDNTEVGSLAWSLSDVATGNVLQEGTTTPRLQDFTIDLVESPTQTAYWKHFRITDQWQFGIAGTYHATPEIGGFALRAQREDTNTFCWEWFTVVEGNRATKLQESGEVAIESRKTANGIEVVKTEFLTDVSVRVADSLEGSGSPDPAWRLLIKKGSEVTWPSLVGGTVKAN